MTRQGKVYTPSQTMDYERHVKACAREAGIEPFDGDSRLWALVMVYFPDKRRRDLDNVAKSILDALNHLVYRDDSQIHWLMVAKFLDRNHPRVEVQINDLSVARSTAEHLLELVGL